MGHPVGVRDFGAQKWRRMQAGRLLEQGVIESEVAHRLGPKSAIRDSLGAAACAIQFEEGPTRGCGPSSVLPAVGNRARVSSADARHWDMPQ